MKIKKNLSKKNILFCLILACAVNGFSQVPDRELCKATDEYSPWVMNKTFDSIFMTTGIAWALTGHFLPETIDYGNEWNGQKYDKDELNSLDRFFVKGYDSTSDHLSTLGVFFNMGLLPAVVMGTELYNKNLPLKDAGTIAAVYAETFFWTYGTKNMLKYSHRRIRPYMYTDKINDEEIEDFDYTNSFPSGHACYPAMSAAFLTCAFNDYYPDSAWKTPAIVTAWTCAVATGALRMSSGEHFFTDVITGEVLGTLFGFGIPILHKKVTEHINNNSAVSVQAFPGTVNVCIKL